MEKVRLQKFIADSGFCSRRKAEEYIVNKKVTVNGILIDKLGSTCSVDDVVAIDGKVLQIKKNHHYLKVYKPRGYITTCDDPQGRKTIIDLIPLSYGRLFPIGRLDYDSEGLILLTDDGNFSNLIMHPSTSPEKEYVVTCLGEYKGDEIEKLAKGLYITKYAYKAYSAKAKLLEKQRDSLTFSIIIHEGKKREVRRMMETLHHEVINLKRVRIGNIFLEDLKPGEFKELTKEEILSLSKLCTKKAAK